VAADACDMGVDTKAADVGVVVAVAAEKEAVGRPSRQDVLVLVLVLALLRPDRGPGRHNSVW